ncbi:MAG TPA: pantoate--beta-alanine ligase [Chloroflexota bacterium]|nr:pantoate--beta-alanine ligase [Chloroflexota bacterium]
MKVVRTVAAVRAARAALTGPVGLVPTMGALHEGHLSLVRAARGECASVVMSIFVNPTQFGPHEDLSRYPRPIERDLGLAEQAGVDLVFNPSAEEVYPPGFSTYVDVEGPSRRWEGEHRPGHFRGVATVVAKLFTITQPDRAYFGQKDFQQLAVVRRLVADLNLPLEIVGCETVREADGLALSSRNVYLSPDQRRHATALHRALQEGRRRLTAGERDPAALRAAMERILLDTPGVSAEYVAVVDPNTLEPLEAEIGAAQQAHALIAARLGPVRLIDNMALSQ